MKTKCLLLTLALCLSGCIHRKQRLIFPLWEPDFFIHGMSFVNKNGVALNSSEARQSLVNLKQTGLPWVVLIINGFQETIDSTRLPTPSPLASSVQEVAQATLSARQLGFQVAYKFHINNQQDASEHWRGQIGSHWETTWEWDDWFRNYQKFIWPYLKIAEQLKIPLLCVGNELTATEKQNEHWRNLIRQIRTVYRGYLVYGANWHPGPDQVTWWSELDFIGVSAYFPLTNDNDPSRQALAQNWENNRWLYQINWLSAHFQKPVIFTEIGYRSVDGANRAPWEYRFFSSVDLMEQADLYYVAMEYVRSRSWIKGLIWWEWFTTTQAGGPEDISFTPFNKPAERLLKILKRP